MAKDNLGKSVSKRTFWQLTGQWMAQGWSLLVGSIASLAIVIALVIATPVLFVLSNIFANTSNIWQHLATTVLSTYLSNSFWLMLGVGTGVFILGVSTAWLVTMCKFPGSRIWEWALLLPLAAPTYLLGYTYTDFLDFSGPIQTGLRQIFGWEYGEYWFPNIRSLGGAIALFSLTLYPYVYLLTRVAFLEQSTSMLEASRSLGCGPWRGFMAIALPLARPAIVAGVALALMETLGDFGTVQYFGVDTFTTGIYRTWFGLDERVAATQLAALLLLFILWLILLEKWSRRRAKYYQNATRFTNLPKYKLTKIRGYLALFICLIPLTFGLLVPAGVLVQMTIENASINFDQNFWQYVTNSLILATVTAILGVILALVIAYAVRLKPTQITKIAAQIAAMGYAVPGSVIAVGTMMPMGQLDNAIDFIAKTHLGFSTGLLFSGTITALIFAYLVRFLAVGLGAVESSLGKIKPNLDEAARALGHTPFSTLIKVHAPMMRGGLLTAIMLVFVDVMKELPATIIIRPFNFDTLAVRVYNLAADERLAEAAAPALTIIAVGIIPVMILSWRIAHSRDVTTNS